MRIHQLLVGANPGDAITEAALRLGSALGKVVDSKVYAIHVHPELADVVHRLEFFPRDGHPSDVLIVHVSIGEPGLVDFVQRSPERVVLNYHNITPASFFGEADPEFARRLRAGRWELKSLAGSAIGAIADSGFNASELRSIGLTDVVVAPPPLHLDRLHGVTPDAALSEELDAIEGPVVLTVGQILPHKRPDLAIDVLHFLNVNHRPDARLFVAGRFTSTKWASALVRHVEHLKLSSARVLGEVTDCQLAALYRRADAMLVTSEHEGFCVPIVEAFSFGVPVVARDFGAIKETANGAAIVLPATAGAPELTEALARVLSDGVVRAELRTLGFRQAEELSAASTLAGAVVALEQVLVNAAPPSADV